MANQWFRLYAEFATDQKVQMLSETDQRRLVMLMCLQLTNNNNHLDDGMVSFQLRITDTQTNETKKVLVDCGFIDSNWVLSNPLETAPLRPLTHIWTAIRSRIFERDNYTCQYCGKRGVKLECDHVIPVSRGGLHNDENLVTACLKCNRSKSDKLLSEWSTL